MAFESYSESHFLLYRGRTTRCEQQLQKICKEQALD